MNPSKSTPYLTENNQGMPDQARPAVVADDSERGSALFIAMIMILILTFVGFGFLTRTLLVSQIAGAERWTTKAFFAADAGLNAAKARLRIRRTEAFIFNVEDLRGASGVGHAGNITVSVSDFSNVGAPVMVTGTQVGGGQGSGSEPLYTISYKGTSIAVNAFMKSEAEVTSTQSISPVPLSIPAG